MRTTLPAAVIPLVAAGWAAAEPVYDFNLKCREDQLGACLETIRERAARLREAENGRRFCLPRAWGATMFESTDMPVSVLEHIRVGLSAARFGQASEETDGVISAILASLYPCD